MYFYFCNDMRRFYSHETFGTKTKQKMPDKHVINAHFVTSVQVHGKSSFRVSGFPARKKMVMENEQKRVA